MQIQKVEIHDGDDFLNTRIINVPCENGEKIISKEPYILEHINLYRSTLGGGMDSVRDFETRRGTSLVDDAIVEKSNGRIFIDINSKYSYSIPEEEEPSDVLNMLEEGQKCKLSIAVKNDKELNVSIKDSLKLSIKSELISKALSHDTSQAYVAKVVESINGGYWVDVSGVKCFMPGSTASFYKLNDFTSIIDKEMYVIPVMYDRKRDVPIVSYTDYLDIIRPAIIMNIVNADKNTLYHGKITLKKHNYVLVVFNECLAGKLEYQDMNPELQSMFMDDLIEVDKTEIDFYVDLEKNGQFNLTQNWYTKNLWENKINKEFKKGLVLDGVVVAITKKNTLIQIAYNVLGIINAIDVAQLNDHLKVKITDINIQDRKIKLQTC